ncbi:MAG: prepilin-type N-terminal cleavage/methylation domain-containing protein [Hyphomicrobiaceae bacterium]|nr:prepilin-type N-terminal cleavage/methylation domain-containing protein [Hyphomicrobiaceae bacterium]
MSARPPVSSRPTTEAGFTLIELLVGLAVLSLGTLVALPLARDALRSQDLRGVATELASAARSARAAAMRSGTERALVLDTAARQYWLDEFPSPRPIAPGIAVEAAVPAGERGAGGVHRIRFLAAGGSSGGRIVLRERSASATLSIDWLTGGARVAYAP